MQLYQKLTLLKLTLRRKILFEKVSAAVYNLRPVLSSGCSLSIFSIKI